MFTSPIWCSKPSDVPVAKGYSPYENQQDSSSNATRVSGRGGYAQENAIVRYLLDDNRQAKIDMNHLAILPFSKEDREQFAQLIGYSVVGFGELDYVSNAAYEKALAAAKKLQPKRKR